MFYHAATNGEEKNAGRERERERGWKERRGDEAAQAREQSLWMLYFQIQNLD